MPTQIAFPHSTPESQGVSSAAISTFIDGVHAQKLELHSLMLLRHGHVIAEGYWTPFSADRVHLLYSLSKSFTSTAIGLAVEEGRLSVDDPVLAFFPDKAPAQVSDHLAAMRVHHLLSMATGHKVDTLDRAARASSDGDWVKSFLAIPPDQAPGTIFCYNNGATFMLSAIIQKLTGMKLLDYLRPRLLDPLGIEQAHWQENPQGINLGFSGLHITTRSIARLGQLYLQKGYWFGRQLLPAEWVDRATTSHIDSAQPGEGGSIDWAQGYGYQFWRCRHNSYRGDGAFGQFCVIMPEQDAVLAITSGVGNMQAVLDLAWDHLLPAMGNATLMDEPDALHALQHQLDNLTIAPIAGAANSATAAAVSGRTFQVNAGQADWGERMPAIEQISFNFTDKQWQMQLTNSAATSATAGGYGQWTSGTLSFFGAESDPVMVSGAWSAPDIFTVAVRFIETPHALTLDAHFGADALRLNARWNVSFGPLELPPLEFHV
ncbi:MAG: serine hydrolase [Caldilineaceae bacterium]